MKLHPSLTYVNAIFYVTKHLVVLCTLRELSTFTNFIQMLVLTLVFKFCMHKAYLN